MSMGVSGKALRSAVAVASLMAATSLSGCSGLSGRMMGPDAMSTGSVASSATDGGSLSQPMPSALGADSDLAMNQFLPPSNVGNGMSTTPGALLPPAAFANSPTAFPTSPIGGGGSVSTGDLPVLSSTTNSLGNPVAMPATQTLAPLPVAAAPLPQGTGSPTLASGDAYVHVIQSGESLYTIARKYDVTTQAIVVANGFSSPDKIFVGQKIKIPGRGDLNGTAQLSAPAPTQMAAIDEGQTSSPLVTTPPKMQSTAAVADPTLLAPPETPVPLATKVAVQAPVAAPAAGEPKMSGAEKFRWPVSGKVIADFAQSKQTGINIEIPEGSTVKAAENGTVIYVGSGVEGYGNLVLIRHPNGYVSAYAHLQTMSVSKGQIVNRGDNIALSGMTGSVTKPQLHFELRKGATPVDPLPMLAT
ncbi:MAG: hypothetical protein JWR75_563 [Devosia sp.]|nr:hypothetical protein [Devosia sp.]